MKTGIGHPLISLAARRDVRALSLFAQAAATLEVGTLGRQFSVEVEHAPRRGRVAGSYFVGHTGRPSGGAGSNRREEHLAMALWNEYRDHDARLPSGEVLRLLDYQFPLKARRGDSGIGKVDLFGVVSGRACVIELKVKGAGYPDTPLRGLLEALAYAAVVRRNREEIAAEVGERLNVVIHPNEGPDVIVLGPSEYWDFFRRNPAAGPWADALKRLIGGLEPSLDLRVHLLELSGWDFDMGAWGVPPSVTRVGEWREALPD